MAELRISFSFLQHASAPPSGTSAPTTAPGGAIASDLVFDVFVDYFESPLPATDPVPLVGLQRFEGNKLRGHVSVFLPQNSGDQFSLSHLAAENDQGFLGIKPGASAVAKSSASPATGATSDPSEPVPLSFAPERRADSLRWHFYVTSQAGGGGKAAPPVLKLFASATGAPAASALSPPTASKPMPPPASNTRTDTPFGPGIFPRLVVGIDLATVPAPPPPQTSLAAGFAADIQPALQRVFDRLTAPDPLADAFAATLPVGVPTQRVAPAPNQSASTQIQDAERAWANQVAEMLICTPYGGPNALYQLNDDDLIARSIQDAGAPKPPPTPRFKAPKPPSIQGRVYPIVFACQHLGSFALAARGASLLQPNFNGDRLQLLAAGSICANTWVTTKIGKWVVTAPGGAAPVESTDGGQGNPANLTPSDTLGTSPLLFQIASTVATTHPFGSAAVFVYANRKAQSGGDCSIVNGVEVCLLRDAKGAFRMEDVPVFESRTVVINGVQKTRKVLAKNADGTIKTIRQIARTQWALFKGSTKAGDPLADNTAGAHVAFVLRTDNRAQVFQMLDTGGVNVPKRGLNVELVPPVAGFHGGIFDDPATAQVNQGSHDPFRGVGVVAAINTSQAATLLQHVQDLKLARPMGFVRFVILTRGAPITYQNYWRFKEPSQNFLLYASPALPMYDAKGSFPISRFLWAMREFPDAANVEAMCFFYVPQGPLGLSMMAAQRSDRGNVIANAALQNMTATDRVKYVKKGAPDVARILADFSLPVLNATVDPDGKVKLVATYKTKLLNNRGMSLLHGLEGRYGSRALLPLDQTFLRGIETNASFPAYFKEP